MKPLAPNTLLQNRYLIVHLIGKGGMGDVYLAVDQRLGSAIALKRTFHGDDVQLGDAFEREARTLARLRHPALPKVSDHFTENENQFLVMEHIAGDDLSARLKATGKPFPLSWVLYWADQLLDALAYLHSHEPPIIHRDIKPQNLKLTDDNNIVLLDFGLSKNSAGQHSTSGPSGSTGSVVGYTPHYAPMEQIRGTGTNPRSDLYSLSATLYQLLTNVIPPDALSRADFLLSGKTDPIAPINEVNHEIPKEISDVVLRGMSISQDQRFPDAREMQKALRETYARLQQKQAERDVARSVQEDQPTPVAPVIIDTAGSAAPIGDETIPFGVINVSPDAIIAVDEPAPAVAGISNPPTPTPIESFDQTVRMDEPLPVAEVTASSPEPEPSVKQADIKTEVMIGGLGIDLPPVTPEETPVAAAPEVIDVATSANAAEPADYGATFLPTAAKPVEDVPSFVPEAAENTAVFNVSEAAVASASEQSFADVAAAVPEAPPKAAAAAASAAKVAAKSAVPKQSKGKTGMLVGILAGLVGIGVIAVLGVVGVWYYVNTTGTEPLPEQYPSASPTPLATPEVTPEPTPVDTNANVDANLPVNSADDANTSSNSSDANTNTVTATPTPAESPRPGFPTPPPATRTPIVPRPSGPTPPPVQRTPVPKPSVAKPDPKPTQRGTRDIVQ